MNILLYLSQQATIQQGAAAVALPAGIIVDYGGTVAPSGWLLCDGAEVAIATYPLLYGAIGVTFGIGNGATTFNVPDCRGRASIGVGAGLGLTNRAINAQGGEETHVLSTAEMPAHTHAVTDPGHFHSPSGGGSFVTTAVGGGVATGGPTGPTGDLHTDTKGTGISLSNTGGGGAHQNMPPYIALTAIISTGA